MIWRSDRARNIYSINSSSGNVGTAQSHGGLTSEESSESEFVEEEKPWPPRQERLSRSRAQQVVSRVPRPHSHLFRLSGGRCRGSKHTRRWENSMFLSTLHQIPEEELEFAASILPTHHSPLSQLHTSDKHMQIWCSFTSRTEEEQAEITSSQVKTLFDPLKEHSSNECLETEGHVQDMAPPPPEQSFKQIKSRIRGTLRRNKHLPMGMMEGVEEELRYLFGVDSGAVLLVLQTNAFARLLLHGISQYMGLHSTTEHSDGGSVVIVECTQQHFLPPDTPLSTYIRSKSS